MSTSSSELDNIISHAPKAIGPEFGRLVSEAVENHWGLTFDQIYSKIGTTHRGGLVLLLGEIVNSGLARQIFRVESPTEGAGIKDFDSLTEIPGTILDYHVDAEIEVKPSNVKVVYQF